MKLTYGIFKNLEETFAEAALAEMGVGYTVPEKIGQHNVWEFIERNLVEGVYAEFGEKIELNPRRVRSNRIFVMPDDCHFGDNETCHLDA